jgi:hypothetical protein
MNETYEYYSVGSYSYTQIHIGYFKRDQPMGIVLLTESSGNTYVKNNFPSESVYEIFQYESELNKYENTPYEHQLGYIHIPKTGGLDLTNKFIPLLAYEHKFIIKTPDLHNTTAEMYKIPSFAVLRDPISRFISGFKFMNFYVLHNKYTDINDFLDNTTDNELMEYTYKPQCNWLTGNSNNIYIVKYDEINIYNNIIPMLKNEFDIHVNYDFSNYEKTNVGNSSNLNCTLNSENIERLNRFYSQDIIYYDRLVASGLPYCKFSELQL